MTLLALHPIVSGLLPEIILVAAACLILMLGVIRAGTLAPWIAAIALLLAAVVARWLPVESAPAVASLNLDSLIPFTRLAVLFVGLLILLVNSHVPEDYERAEFFALILFSLAGISLVAVANDLVFLFLALELVSVPTYILVGLSRRHLRAQEATGKYFFLGAFAAAMTLYGFSFLYGVAGTMQIFPSGASTHCIAQALASQSIFADRMTLIGLVLVIGGLAFKLAAVPFHFYVADVYQGAASPVTGLLGFVPKFAGFLAIIRILSMAGWQHSPETFWLLWAIAAATMTVGNTLALMQHNVKRMLAYSGVAHSGYMLVALLAGPRIAGGLTDSLGQRLAAESPLRSGLAAILFYIVIYGIMNLGAFAAISYLRKISDEGEDDSVESLEDLSGSARAHPWAALALAICVLSLMGLPPTGGFIGKLYIFSSAVTASAGSLHEKAILALIIIGMLNAAVAAAYYLRIIAVCYLGKPAPGIRPNPCRALHVGLALCAALVAILFVKPATLFSTTQEAVANLSTYTEPARIANVDDAP